jgi:hypothetical protein
VVLIGAAPLFAIKGCANRQRGIIELLEQTGANVEYDFESKGVHVHYVRREDYPAYAYPDHFEWPEECWLATVFGIDVFHRVDAVDFGSLTSDGKAIDYLHHLSGLREVVMDSCDANDRCVARLNGLNDLQILSLACSSITDEGMRDIANLKGIVELNLYESHVTDQGLTYLTHLPHLAELGLDANRITDAGAKVVAELPSIRVLSIGRTDITDNGLRFLARSGRGFEYVDLRMTRITDASVPELAKMRSLTEVDIRGTNISQKGVAALKKALPNATIREDASDEGFDGRRTPDDRFDSDYGGRIPAVG